MEGLNYDTLEKHRQFRERKTKLIIIFPVIAVAVAVLVFWWLKLVGITITGDAFCGLEEHTHNEECYTAEYICEAEEAESSLSEEYTSEASSSEESLTQSSSTESQTQSEDTENITESGHIHSDSCLKKTLICKLPEHTHSAECFPDTSADTETVSDWLKTFENVEITNDIPENLISIALTQKGYSESQLNYEFDAQGNKWGYTRYGEWYGNPYGQWNTIFVAFCLHYSNINNVSEFETAGAEAMRLAWEKRFAYAQTADYTPQRGDIVFLDNDKNGVCDTTGIVLSTYETGLTLIAGDIDNSVAVINVDYGENIIGYGLTGELSFQKDMEYDSNPQISAPIEAETFLSEPPIMMFSTGTPQPNITYIEDLTLALVDVHFKTQDGTVLGDGASVYVGQTYIVTLEFKEDNTGEDWIQFQHNHDSHFLHYQIPENLHCEPFDTWHPITALTENGTIEDVGEYFVDEHGYLRVRFHDVEPGVCFGSKYSNVDFVIEFNASVGENLSGSTTEIQFGNQIDVKLNVDGGAAMKMEKSHGEYNEDSHTMDYTIKVEATQGVVKDFYLTDTIWANHVALRDTIVVTDLNGNILDPQPTIQDNPRNGAEKGFMLTDFPDFSAGNGFLITYKSQILDNLLTQEAVEMYNSADGYGKDSNQENVSTWTEDWLKIELEKMEKDGNQAVLQDANGNPVPVIEWEVEIRKDNHNLQGTVVVDTLGEGLSYYTDQAIRIKSYDEWGYKISDEYINWNDVKINGTSMEFTLPDGYAFNIVYYTKYEELAEGEQKEFTNRVSALINGKQETAGGNADVVGFIPHVVKSASGNDGKYAYFTIEADIPAVIKDWGHFYMTDLAAFWGYDNAVGYLYVQNIPEDLVITAQTKSGQVVNFTPYIPGGPIENTFMLISPAQGNQHHSFNILFNTSSTEIGTSKWTLSEDAKLTISYKIPFDAKTGIEWEGELSGDKTLEDVLLTGKHLANEVYLNYTQYVQGKADTIYKYSPTITKKSVVNEDGTIDYTVVFHNTVPGSGGNSGYLSGASSIVFNDTFDERMEYVTGSLQVTCYDPWQNWLWLNKYKYNGQVSGNTISVSATDLVFSEYNYAEAQELWNTWPASLQNYQIYCNNMSGGEHVFTYTLKIKDEYLNSPDENILHLDNTAEITWDNDGSSGPVTEETEFKTGLLDKQVVQENNRLKFDIHVNNNALDILPGTDKLTIEDTMTKSLSVYWDTIKLYYEDANGNWVDFDSNESIHKYTVTYDQASNKLIFVVPDSLHIRIDYTTLITENGHVSVNNSVKIDGKAQVTDIIDAIFKVEEHSGGASGSNHKITLLKQDGETNASLSGVTFHMYGPMGDPHATLPNGASTSILSEKGKNLYYIGTYTTGADGTVIIDTQYLTIGGPYALVEAAPPEGYLPLQKPAYFYFYEPDPDGIMQTVTTIIAVENYTYGFVFPETGGTGTLPTAIIGISLMAFPILYSIIRRKRERRLTKSPEA